MYHVVAILLLGFNVGVVPLGVVRTVIVAIGGAGNQCRRGLLHELFNFHVGLGIDGPNAFQFGFNQGLEFIQTNPVYQNLQAGHHAVLTKHVGVVEDGEYSQGQPEDVFLREEIV